MNASTKILLIDDEEDFTELFAANLESIGNFEVQQVNDPLKAVRVATAFGPDLCIVDVVMPGMDGGDVVVALRAVPELKEVPVLMLTALVEEDHDSPVGESFSGGLPFVSKTSEFEKILSAIEEHLSEGQ
jgi:two-component system OmpR family response regulator